MVPNDVFGLHEQIQEKNNFYQIVKRNNIIIMLDNIIIKQSISYSMSNIKLNIIVLVTFDFRKICTLFYAFQFY